MIYYSENRSISHLALGSVFGQNRIMSLVVNYLDGSKTSKRWQGARAILQILTKSSSSIRFFARLSLKLVFNDCFYNIYYRKMLIKTWNLISILFVPLFSLKDNCIWYNKSEIAIMSYYFKKTSIFSHHVSLYYFLLNQEFFLYIPLSDLWVLSMGAFNHESPSSSKALNIYVRLVSFI